MSRFWHPNVARVADTLIARGHHGLITRQPDSVTTAEQAAAAVGADVGSIVKSLVFLLDDEPILLLVSGAHRVALDRTGERLGGTLAPAPRSVVVEVTGQPVGGVAPLGHPTNLPTYIDRSLKDHAELWAAGGCANTLFRTTYRELMRVTAGIDVDVD
ncbi:MULTISPECIES: YbaK/EbsC family protein [unclassified Rhodococcus (in: high G+C Gram-positive bacteria)]|jgi:prolyl-tRNA editing enzyme YbaK/EbsC (Cys-tRNA(Pro) deacylase)|uniref:YbaK/EbsC family protein n=1 Tax=unclassified Rhodococcus (in: high G+C Gram-positive bacteria) TaxID=192944 RepID=UPI00146C7433|nr:MULTISPECIES: YbaK/EbsC family protein [unclassified Rhodococcus (in: high G+C Gram-positive bacteria)]MBF0663720.1 YbaK/EbsC family protein [Rhodococcus sp. (in: high G+C Gram-positive bacteria)]NMD97511.1 YbaK/EbsC family protein [Rhodococcus sp. BL-253-APC-6A1W]